MAENEASRRYFAPARTVSRALQSAFNWALWRATLVTIAVAFLGGVAVGFLGLADEIGPRNPSAAIAVTGLLFLVFVGAHAMLLWHALGGQLGAALDVIEWTNREVQVEWASQGSAVPRTREQAQRWLDAHPETDTNLPQRVLASVMTGDVAGARDSLSRYPVNSAFERHQRAADGLAVDLVEGRYPSAVDVDAAFLELGDEHRYHAATCRADFEAAAAVLSDGDWRAPLARARPALPESIIDRGRRKAWRFFFAVQAVVGALTLGGVLAIWLLVFS